MDEPDKTMVMDTIRGTNGMSAPAETDVDKTICIPTAAAVQKKEVPPAAGDDVIGLDELKDHYLKISTFASGGQGILSQGLDHALRRRVAIKTLREELSDQADQRKAFIDEARITAQLDHPAIIPVHSLHKENDKTLAVTMKLVQGENFQSYLQHIISGYEEHGFRASEEAKSLRERLDIFLKICDALEYAHSRNVMHCDLKPENIMIGQFHEAYLMDWGIAHPIRSTEYDPENWTVGKRVSGTPRFISPETVRGEYCDQRADIYSMGIILFETVVLQPAFPDGTVKETLERVCRHEILPVKHRFGYAVNPDLAAIIRKATTLDPAARYQQISELSADLRRCLRQEEVSANPDNLFRKLFRSCVVHHGKALVITTLTCLLIAVGAASFALFTQLRQERFTMARNMTIGTWFINCLESADAFDLRLAKTEQALSSCVNTLIYLLDKSERVSVPMPEEDKKTMPVSDYTQKEKCPETYRSYPQYGGYFDFSHTGYMILSKMDSKKEMEYINAAGAMFSPMQNILLQAHDSARMNTQQVQTILQQKSPVSLVYFYLKDGFYVCYPGKSYKDGYDPQKRQWYQNRWNPESPACGWGTPYLNFGETGLVMTYSIRMERNGVPIGVAALDLDLSDVLAFVRSRDDDMTGVLEKTFVDENGCIIATSNARLNGKASMQYRVSKTGGSKGYLYPDSQLIREMKKYQKSYLERTENGRRVIYVYSKCSTVNWFFFIKIDLQKYMDKLTQGKSSVRSI